MLPLCNKAISLQIDRPSPDIFLLASVVNNGSNILSIKFLSTPVPLSATSNCIYPSFFSTIILISFFGCSYKYLILLEIVLLNILLIFVILITTKSSLFVLFLIFNFIPFSF